MAIRWFASTVAREARGDPPLVVGLTRDAVMGAYIGRYGRLGTYPERLEDLFGGGARWRFVVLPGLFAFTMGLVSLGTDKAPRADDFLIWPEPPQDTPQPSWPTPEAPDEPPPPDPIPPPPPAGPVAVLLPLPPWFA